MREKHVYILKGNKTDITSITNRLKPSSASYNGFQLSIYTDTDDYKLLLEESHRLGVHLTFAYFEMEYLKSELDSAQYFLIFTSSYCSDYAEEYGTVYNYDDSCNCCGSGKKQVSELFIDKTKMGKKDIASTYSNEIVISQKTYSVLKENGVTGAEFRDVRHKNTKLRNEPILYQLICMNTLPPINERTVTFKEDFCECCQRSGLFSQSPLYYDIESFNNAKDFNYTFEYFGGGLSGHPYIIISQKVYSLLQQQKIKGVQYYIVNLV